MHLFIPPSVRRFAPDRTLPGPGLRHAGLEYDLVEALRPELVVDLGTGDAMSFFAYCQSMIDHDVDGTCYAIDTWEESSTTHPQATFDAILAHGRARYPGISYFVRMPPIEGQRHFSENTIDLLRVDGTRPSVIAEADVEAWLRCVRAGGIIVWHGTEANPGAWSVLTAQCRAAVFSAGRGGLGLARKEGPEPTAELLRLLFVEDEAMDLERLYRHVHEHLEFGRRLPAAMGKVR
jgi:hypothetical protein